MSTVTVSPKYQVVIPSDVRRQMGIKPGHRLEVLAYDGRVEFVPVENPPAMRGCLKGIDTSVPREKDRW